MLTKLILKIYPLVSVHLPQVPESTNTDHTV